MNWIQKISHKSIIKEISERGWSKDQLFKDGIEIYKSGNDFFVSLGDWSKIDPSDISEAIHKIYPNSKVEWDFECGPPKTKKWKSIF